MASEAQPHQYHRFDNLGGKTQTLCIRSITQSDDGMMWFGAEDGLYSYDGYHLQKRVLTINGKSKEDLSLGCLNSLAASPDSLLIGCERGVLSFNLHTYTFQLLPYTQGKNVKGIARTEGHWWVATEDALYCDGTPMPVRLAQVFSMTAIDSYLYIGTREGVMRYGLRDRHLEKLTAEIDYVTCFSPAADKGLVWIGGATHAIVWHTTTAQTTFNYEVPVAKAMCTDQDGNLLIGTDHGLFIIGQDKNTHHILHDARIDTSLAGDAVWSLFRDRDDNIWMGTNSGISMVPANDLMNTYPLPSITGEGTGNQLFCIHRDRQGRIWMGGSNGLLCVEHLDTPHQTYRWYRMNDAHFPLRHNRIRTIHTDTHGRVWIGGDGGLFLFNESTSQLERYEIPKDTNNWVYLIEDAPHDALAVTTFNATYIAQPDLSTLQLHILKKEARRNLDTPKQQLETLLARYGLPHHYLSAHLDKSSHTLLLGGTDFFAILHTDKAAQAPTELPLHITDIQQNGNQLVPHADILAQTATFAPHVGTLQFFFSDHDYANHLPDHYSYRLSTEEEWTPLPPTVQSITFTNLAPGTYQLYLRPTHSLSDTSGDNPSYLTPIFTFTIQAPWYATPLAKTLYVFLFLAICYGIYRFIQQRKRLQRERAERAALLAQAKEKERQLLSDNEYLAAQLKLRLMEKSGSDGELSSDEKFLFDITHLIEQNMDDPELNVNTLSQKSGISTKQLYRRIKTITGMTTVAYIRDQRLKKAASLLAKGTFTISEVMYRVGFSSASYFTRCFCDEYGMPPSEYKEEDHTP